MGKTTLPKKTITGAFGEFCLIECNVNELKKKCKEFNEFCIENSKLITSPQIMGQRNINSSQSLQSNAMQVKDDAINNEEVACEDKLDAQGLATILSQLNAIYLLIAQIHFQVYVDEIEINDQACADFHQTGKEFYTTLKMILPLLKSAKTYNTEADEWKIFNLEKLVAQANKSPKRLLVEVIQLTLEVVAPKTNDFTFWKKELVQLKGGGVKESNSNFFTKSKRTNEKTTNENETKINRGKFIECPK